MKLFGKVIAFIARFLLYRDCQKLKAELVRIYSEYGQSMKQDISPRFSDFLIVAEDRRFSTHSGIDVIAVIRAIWKYLLYRQLSGASTIQQQLVRTIQRRYERSFRRKIREMMLACVVSEVMEKYEILDSYLHVAYFGWRMNGLDQACGRLGINIAHPTPQQAATVVARLKYPEPEIPSPKRLQQIANRTQYLLNLVLKKQVNRSTILSQGEIADATVQR